MPPSWPLTCARGGIVDIGAYRGVGANQLRIGTWPSMEMEDVEALLACIDYCLERVL